MGASRPWTLLALVLAVGVALGPGLRLPEAQQKNILVSKKVAAPPPIAPVMGDAWKTAAPLVFKVIGGENLHGGRTEVTMHSVHTEDTVSFLVEYQDPTLSPRREPWHKQADGPCTQLKDPNDKGGDNNLLYEDKLSIFWNISSPGFEQKGGMAACHTGEGKPYGTCTPPTPESSWTTGKGAVR